MKTLPILVLSILFIGGCASDPSNNEKSESVPQSVEAVEQNLDGYNISRTTELSQLVTAFEMMAKAHHNMDLTAHAKVIQDNETFPVLLVDENDQVLSARNVAEELLNDADAGNTIQIMKAANEPIALDLPDGSRNYVYYCLPEQLTQP